MALVCKRSFCAGGLCVVVLVRIMLLHQNMGISCFARLFCIVALQMVSLRGGARVHSVSLFSSVCGVSAFYCCRWRRLEGGGQNGFLVVWLSADFHCSFH